MLKWFIHPETRENLEVEKCLKEGLLSDYYPLSYLNLCAEERQWKGKPSTTQILGGLRAAYLKIVTDYAIDPDDQTFRIIGSMGHKRFEGKAHSGSFSELMLDESEVSGILDLVEQQPNGEWWLDDLKTGGAFWVAKTLGLVKKKRPMLDDKGNQVTYKRSSNGYKAGYPRLEDYFIIDESQRDIHDLKYQLNKYRMDAERLLGIKISRLNVFATPRDGGTQIAKGYGVTKKTYYIEIPKISNEDVINFFNPRAEKLISCINSFKEKGQGDFKKFAPAQCAANECWGGRKCQAFCPVSRACKEIGCTYL